MSNGTIAIFDSETEYALKLAEYFNLKSGLNYSVSVFTDFQSLENYLSDNHIDILLISEAFSSYTSQLKNVTNIFILTEGNMDSVIKEYSVLYKYQSSDCILRDVMSCYASSTDSVQHPYANASPAKIIGVYSPVKRCGKTCFSIAYGCIASLTENCLYINLEEYPGFRFFVNDSPVGDLSDLLYFYRQNPQNIDKKLISLSRTYHNMTYIPPMQFSYDIKNMEGNYLSDFIQAISRTEHFQNIILDLSDSVKEIPEILSICDKIYMPSTTDPISQYKIDDFFQSTSAIFHCSIKEKTEILFLPYVDSELFPEETTAHTHSSDFIEQLLFSEFGIYIRKLLEQEK